jgi:hypothetical protein
VLFAGCRQQKHRVGMRRAADRRLLWTQLTGLLEFTAPYEVGFERRESR